MLNYSNDNEFDLHENTPLVPTPFNLNSCASGLALKRRQTANFTLGTVTCFSEQAIHCFYAKNAPKGIAL